MLTQGLCIIKSHSNTHSLTLSYSFLSLAALIFILNYRHSVPFFPSFYFLIVPSITIRGQSFSFLSLTHYLFLSFLFPLVKVKHTYSFLYIVFLLPNYFYPCFFSVTIFFFSFLHNQPTNVSPASYLSFVFSLLVFFFFLLRHFLILSCFHFTSILNLYLYFSLSRSDSFFLDIASLLLYFLTLSLSFSLSHLTLSCNVSQLSIFFFFSCLC